MPVLAGRPQGADCNDWIIFCYNILQIGYGLSWVETTVYAVTQWQKYDKISMLW